MKRLVGYENLEYGRKKMILEEIDEKTPEMREWQRERRAKVAEKFKFKTK